MRNFACILACLAALTAQSLAQFGGGGGNPFGPRQPQQPGGPPVGPGPGQPGGGNPGFGPGGGNPGFGPGGGNPGFGPGFGQPANPAPGDPNRKERCAKFWLEENGSCYLYDSGAFLRRAGAFNPTIMNQDGLFQAAANMYCGSLVPGATLVTINNKIENDFLYEWVLRMMPEPQQVWIGLTVNMTAFPPQWSWFSGEPVTYINWEHGQMVRPEPGVGAMLFDADPLIQLNNQVDVSAQWVPEGVMNERHPFICEYHPAGMQATNAPPTTPGMTTGRPPVSRQPAMLRGGSRFGGSLLHEVPRRRNGPANYRMNPYYGVMP